MLADLIIALRITCCHLTNSKTLGWLKACDAADIKYNLPCEPATNTLARKRKEQRQEKKAQKAAKIAAAYELAELERKDMSRHGSRGSFHALTTSCSLVNYTFFYQVTP